jgi:hypothetical protein
MTDDRKSQDRERTGGSVLPYETAPKWQGFVTAKILKMERSDSSILGTLGILGTAQSFILDQTGRSGGQRRGCHLSSA